jgi:hypothetical protein
MRKIYILGFICMLALTSSAQTDINLTINHMLGDNAFNYNQESTNDVGAKFNVSRLEYYISDISITHDSGKVSYTTGVYILANGSTTDTINLGSFDVDTVEAISFSIGVDPGVNNQDPAQWASDHPLAPKSPSMHWGWASGYRFVAMEGKAGDALNKTFEVHALGNKNYFGQRIRTGATSHDGGLLITLNADYDKAISTIDVSPGLILHGEDREGKTVLENFRDKVFTSTSGEGNSLSLNNIRVKDAFAILPNPNQGNFKLDINDTRFVNSVVVIKDISGRIIYTDNAAKDISILSSGIYFVTLLNDSNSSTEKLIVN